MVCYGIFWSGPIDPQNGRLATWLQTKNRPKNKMYLREWKHEVLNELMNERLEFD